MLSYTPIPSLTLPPRQLCETVRCGSNIRANVPTLPSPSAYAAPVSPEQRLSEQIACDRQREKAPLVFFRANSIENQIRVADVVLHVIAQWRLPSGLVGLACLIDGNDSEQPSRFGIPAIPKLHGLGAHARG
jgi:hypothetical protein